MSHTKKRLRRVNQCAICVDPTAKEHDASRFSCKDCIIGLLRSTSIGASLLDTRSKLIWITKLILRLQKVLQWARNERVRLEEISVREFLSDFAKKGKEE